MLRAAQEEKEEKRTNRKKSSEFECWKQKQKQKQEKHNFAEKPQRPGYNPI